VLSLCAELFVCCISTQKSVSFLVIDGIHVFICACLNVLDMCLMPDTYILADINGIVPYILRHRNDITSKKCTTVYYHEYFDSFRGCNVR
ncbi:hypothetical protein THOM_1874, partial [Trachipleistophora hominis]